MLLSDFYKNILHIVDDMCIKELVKISRIKFFKKGQILISEGEVPSHIYFLIHGITRGFIPDEGGKDITDCICFRCGDVPMPDNDLTLPASITIEALKDCEVICVAIWKLYLLMQKYPELSNTHRHLLIYAASRHRNLKVALCQYNAVQRYQWFLKEYPGLIDQVSHKHIASFLNMTPVTLSRVRKAVLDGGTSPKED